MMRQAAAAGALLLLLFVVTIQGFVVPVPQQQQPPRRLTGALAFVGWGVMMRNVGARSRGAPPACSLSSLSFTPPIQPNQPRRQVGRPQLGSAGGAADAAAALG